MTEENEHTTDGDDDGWTPTNFVDLEPVLTSGRAYGDRLGSAGKAPGAVRWREPPGFITAQQAADLMGVSRKTIYRYAEAKEFPTYRLPGGTFRFKRIEFEGWIEGLREEPSAHDIEPWQK